MVENPSINNRRFYLYIRDAVAQRSFAAAQHTESSSDSVAREQIARQRGQRGGKGRGVRRRGDAKQGRVRGDSESRRDWHARVRRRLVLLGVLRVTMVRGALQLAVMLKLMLMLNVVILTVVQRQIVMGMRTRMQLAVMLMMLMLRVSGWRRRCGVARRSGVRSVRVGAELTHVQRRRLRCSCRRR